MAEENENANANAEETKAPAEEKGLSLDDALAAAIEKHQPKEKEAVTDDKATDRAEEVKPGSEASVPKEPATTQSAAEEEVSEGLVEPPQEFNSRGRDAWTKGDLKTVKEEMQRVLHGRLSEMTRLQNENQPYKELVRQVAPYLEAAGNQGKPPAQAVTEAIAVVNALKADPLGTAREIVRLAKLKPEQVFGNEKQNPPSPEINALQTQVESLSSKVQKQETEELGRQYGAIFQSLQAEGKYPDLEDNERGIQLAANIGSLTRSPDFIRAVRALNPGAGLRELTIKAYATLGGRIVEPNSVSSQPKANHIDKARRASASVPGRAPASVKGEPKKKYSDLGSALEAALALHSE